MKNKWYIGLWILYIFMVGFILYINGVFTGGVSLHDATAMSNLLINVIFLLLIGVLFLISTLSFLRLNRCTEMLSMATAKIRKEYDGGNKKLWEVFREKKVIFGNPALDEAFGRYQKRMKGYQTRRGLVASCDVEEYLNEDLIDSVGLTYFNSAISGTMTGLGILGTFIGLSIGLGSFSGDDIYTISDNVGPLLGGMKVAFHTSVYGIFFSLVFNFVYRSIMSDAYEKLSDFLITYRECVEPKVVSKDENASTMLVYQANMANSMKEIKELLKGNAMEQTAGLERIVNQFTERLGQMMGADFAKLGSALQQTSSTQEAYVHSYRSMEETTLALLEANRNLAKALEQNMKQQEEFAQKLQEQGSKLSETCDSLSDEITSQLYTFDQMRDMYEK